MNISRRANDFCSRLFGLGGFSRASKNAALPASLSNVVTLCASTIPRAAVKAALMTMELTGHRSTWPHDLSYPPLTAACVPPGEHFSAFQCRPYYLRRLASFHLHIAVQTDIVRIRHLRHIGAQTKCTVNFRKIWLGGIDSTSARMGNPAHRDGTIRDQLLPLMAQFSVTPFEKLMFLRESSPN